MGLVDKLKNENRELVFKELLGKKYSTIDDFNVVYTPEEEFLLIDIKRLVFEGRINEAENTLFTCVNSNPKRNYIFIAGEFYTMLTDMGDEKLKEYGFSMSEVKEGISDMRDILYNLV